MVFAQQTRPSVIFLPNFCMKQIFYIFWPKSLVMLRTACCFLIACLLVSSANSQGRDRIYVQTDKSGYVAGETVWMKAYLLSGLVPGSIGTNLFIDIRNEAGDAVIRERLPVMGGVAMGSIDLPLSLTQGIYYMRAFTRTQPQQDVYSAAMVPIAIFNPKAAGTAGAARDYTVIFRPASGYLVAGLPNTMFIQAFDQYGHKAAVNGEIRSAANDAVSTFKTDDKGNALSQFIPVAGAAYSARVSFADGTVRNFRLPEVYTDKVLLSISNATDSKLYTITIPEKLRNNSAMTIRGYMDDNQIFEKSFAANAERVAARIPVSELPAGLLQLIVKDARQQKLAQASSWLMPDSALLNASLSLDTVSLKPDGQNVLSLKMPDNLIGSFSVSVTDADRAYYTDQNNIISGLLLNQDSRNQSFVENTDVTDAEQLKFAIGNGDWMDQSLQAGKPSISIDSGYLTIRGKVMNKDNGKPLTKGDLTFMFTSRDSATGFAGATLDKEGNFVLPKMVFEGKQQFRYSLNGNKWTDLKLVVDSVAAATMFEIPFSNSIIADRTVFVNTTPSKDVVELSTALLADSVSSTGLRAVTVQARKVSPIQQVNDRYTRGIFSNSIGARMLDLINDPPIGGGANIMEYLQGKILGLVIIINGDSYSIQSNRQLSLNYMPPTKLFLDEMETTIDFLKTVRAKDVALVKYYPPGMGSFPGVGIAPVLAIYMRKPTDGGTDLAAMGAFTVKGYLQGKDFVTDFLQFSENLASKRQTIYWNPNLKPEENQSVYKIRFNNSATAKRLRVVIEGFTIDGRLLHHEQVIE